MHVTRSPDALETLAHACEAIERWAPSRVDAEDLAHWGLVADSMAQTWVQARIGGDHESAVRVAKAEVRLRCRVAGIEVGASGRDLAEALVRGPDLVRSVAESLQRLHLALSDASQVDQNPDFLLLEARLKMTLAVPHNAQEQAWS